MGMLKVVQGCMLLVCASLMWADMVMENENSNKIFEDQRPSG